MASKAFFADAATFRDLEITKTIPYKRLHLRFCAAVHLIVGFLAWMTIYAINQAFALELRWLFIIVTILSATSLYAMKVREILPKL